MNKEINKQKVGLIIALKPNEKYPVIEFFVVTPETLNKALIISEKPLTASMNERKEWTDHKCSLCILDILRDNIIERVFQEPWIYYQADFLNKYEFVGILPIEVY